MLAIAQTFNQPLGAFDTSQVTSMYGMFREAKLFDRSLDAFDTSRVTNMHSAQPYCTHRYNAPLKELIASSPHGERTAVILPLVSHHNILLSMSLYTLAHLPLHSCSSPFILMPIPLQHSCVSPSVLLLISLHTRRNVRPRQSLLPVAQHIRCEPSDRHGMCAEPPSRRDSNECSHGTHVMRPLARSLVTSHKLIGFVVYLCSACPLSQTCSA
jgi:hypothetical protein